MYSDYLDNVEEKFVSFFDSRGYIQEEAVDITSQVDPTIDFIGSKISPLKHYIYEHNIGKEGRFLIQNCMKLKALKTLQDTTFSTFGSYYKCMGTLTEPDLKKMANDLFDFLLDEEYLNISPRNLCIRINAQDEDLVEAISEINPEVAKLFNTVNMKHYRHKYGMNDPVVTGRDFNFAIRRGDTEDFFNCGTFVVMESEGKKIAVDMGMSNLSIAMCHFGKKTTVECSRIADLIDIDSDEMVKFADAITAVATLLKEDVPNHPSKHFQKKFRQYSHALKLWKNKFGFSNERILDVMVEYLYREYKHEYTMKRDEWLDILSKRI